jgi:N utilization substance protein B
MVCLSIILVHNMRFPQQKLREIVFQLFYSEDFSDADTSNELADLLMGELSLPRTILRIAEGKVKELRKFKDEADTWIREASTSYKFERIPNVEKNILRLGVYELLHPDLVPAKVAIAEAIRLCRKFASPEGASFVNAILDAIFKKLTPTTAPESNGILIDSEKGATP